MSKKEIIFYVLVGAFVGYILGYALGAAKVSIFQGTQDGKYAIVNICDVDGDYRDENDACRNHNKTKISLKRAIQIIGGKWANAGLAVGCMGGFAVASSVSGKKLEEERKRRQNG